MARYDVVDEATFHAPPAVVWKALLREFGGETSWWLPDLEFRPLGDGFSGEIGDEVEVTPHPRGGRPSPIGLAFVGSVRELDAPTRLVVDYVRGAFLGRGEWQLDATGEDTRLRMRWNVRTHGMLPTLLGLVLDIGAHHSRAMQAGFRRLQAVLARDRAPATPGRPRAAVPT